MRRLDVSERWLARQLDTHHQAINKWLAEEVTPRDDGIWGRMWDALSKESQRQDDVEKSLGSGVILEERTPYYARPTVQMRFAGDVPCSEAWGEPLQGNDFIPVPAQFADPERFCAKVKGDSCYPALQQGDITIWHPDKAPAYGTIVLAQRKGGHGCTVKKLVYDDQAKRPVLEPINPASGKPEDGEGWGVIARLIGVERSSTGPTRTWFFVPGLRPSDLL